MRRIVIGVALFASLLVPPAAHSAEVNPATGPAILIEDVGRFYRIYDAAAGHPDAEQLQRGYIDAGSDGLHQFAQVRDITGTSIARTLTRRPEVYANARRCMAVLPRARERLAASLRTLVRLYPAARLPPVTIAVGRGKPVGVGSPATGIQIGLEALCATDYLNPDVEERLVHVVAHEYAHVQQSAALTEDEHPTVLEASLLEGTGELIAELISGDVSYSNLKSSTKGHEREIELAFVADEEKTDLSAWLYNSTSENPGDLGYWVGYRIVKTYYQQASDKKKALREILEMTDPRSFLAESGWHPGIALE